MQQSRSRVRRRWFDLAFCGLGALPFATSLAQAPSATKTMPPPGHPTGAPPPATSAPPAKQRVDINSASRAELKTLPGIGDAEAKKIIAGRPWLTKIDLVTRNVLPEGVYHALRDQIIAKQSGLPVSRK